MVDDNKALMAEKKNILIELTTGFSEQYLNKEYEQVILKLIDKLARKRTVPFSSGKLEIWASAIIHAIGAVNFLFDPSREPHATVGDICEYFDTRQSTIVQKSKLIRDMFKMTYFDGQFSTASNVKGNPFNNVALVNGMIVFRDFLR